MWSSERPGTSYISQPPLATICDTKQRTDQHPVVACRSIRATTLHNCKVYQSSPEVSYSGDRERLLEPSTAASYSTETRLYAEAQISFMTSPLRPLATL